MKFKQIIWSCLLIAVCANIASGQSKKIELLRANTLNFDEKIGVDAQRLLGNVQFRHEGALMYCDSAYLYNAHNSLDAFGHVRIIQGDTLTLHSDKLFYNGNTQVVKVRDQVVLRDQDMKLTTHTLDYDRKTGMAVFYDRGIITSSQNENTLVSCEGIYDSNLSIFYFRDSVVLENPRYRVETDTLNYGNRSEIAYFHGPTFIFSDENTIYCENGWYDTRSDISQFNENAYLNNGKQILKGDSLWYSRNDGVGRAFENVAIIDTTEQINIYGNYGEYLEHIDQTLITGRAELVQYDTADSLFLHADTLLAVADSVYGDKLHAYHNVKFYRTDMQGAADSVVFAQSDSLIHFYKNPILWADDLQITGDTIQIKSKEEGVENLFVFNNAFMVNRADSTLYNQIKGKRLTGYFENNDLYKVLINGNGQSLYYAAEEKKVKVPAPDKKSFRLNTEGDSVFISTPQPDSVLVREQNYIGVNKAICSNIAIYLTDNQVQRIVFLNQPDGIFYPLEKFPEDEQFYDGFTWQMERRPWKREDIFIHDKPVETEDDEEDDEDSQITIPMIKSEVLKPEKSNKKILED